MCRKQLVPASADESHLHAGHKFVKESGASGETHFRVMVVSKAFEGKVLLAPLKIPSVTLGCADASLAHASASSSPLSRDTGCATR
jgi:hypothetical protein